jgi:hypothetical protein
MWGVNQSDQVFFEAFSRHGDTTAAAAGLLLEVLEHPDRVESLVAQIRDAEHEGDKIVHETVNALRATWITPLDRGDIRTLITSLDDVLDLIHAVSERVQLFEITTIPPDAVDLGKHILKATETLKKALPLLRDLKRPNEINNLCHSLNLIEKEGDKCYRASLAKLYKAGGDPLEAMKWREIFENLELALDRCEDVGDSIGGIVLEYS